MRNACYWTRVVPPMQVSNSKQGGTFRIMQRWLPKLSDAAVDRIAAARSAPEQVIHECWVALAEVMDAMPPTAATGLPVTDHDVCLFILHAGKALLSKDDRQPQFIGAVQHAAGSASQTFPMPSREELQHLAELETKKMAMLWRKYDKDTSPSTLTPTPMPMPMPGVPKAGPEPKTISIPKRTQRLLGPCASWPCGQLTWSAALGELKTAAKVGGKAGEDMLPPGWLLHLVCHHHDCAGSTVPPASVHFGLPARKGGLATLVLSSTSSPPVAVTTLRAAVST